MITDDRVIQFAEAHKFSGDIKNVFDYLKHSDICEICTNFACCTHSEDELDSEQKIAEALMEGELGFTCRFCHAPNDDRSDCEHFIVTSEWDLSWCYEPYYFDYDLMQFVKV